MSAVTASQFMAFWCLSLFYAFDLFDLCDACYDALYYENIYLYWYYALLTCLKLMWVSVFCFECWFFGDRLPFRTNLGLLDDGFGEFISDNFGITDYDLIEF